MGFDSPGFDSPAQPSAAALTSTLFSVDQEQQDTVASAQPQQQDTVAVGAPPQPIVPQPSATVARRAARQSRRRLQRQKPPPTKTKPLNYFEQAKLEGQVEKDAKRFGVKPSLVWEARKDDPAELQALIRGMFLRRGTEALRDDKVADLQSRIRGHLARRSFEAQKSEAELERLLLEADLDGEDDEEREPWEEECIKILSGDIDDVTAAQFDFGGETAQFDFADEAEEFNFADFNFGDEAAQFNFGDETPEFSFADEAAELAQFNFDDEFNFADEAAQFNFADEPATTPSRTTSQSQSTALAPSVDPHQQSDAQPAGPASGGGASSSSTTGEGAQQAILAAALWECTFKYGPVPLEVPGVGLLCGIRAMIRSIYGQRVRISPSAYQAATEQNLLRVHQSQSAQSVNNELGAERMANNANFTIDQLETILYHWGLEHGLNLRLGYRLEDSRVFLIGTPTDNEASVMTVWISTTSTSGVTADNSTDHFVGLEPVPPPPEEPSDDGLSDDEDDASDNSDEDDDQQDGDAAPPPKPSSSGAAVAATPFSAGVKKSAPIPGLGGSGSTTTQPPANPFASFLTTPTPALNIGSNVNAASQSSATAFSFNVGTGAPAPPASAWPVTVNAQTPLDSRPMLQPRDRNGRALRASQTRARSGRTAPTSTPVPTQQVPVPTPRPIKPLRKGALGGALTKK